MLAYSIVVLLISAVVTFPLLLWLRQHRRAINEKSFQIISICLQASAEMVRRRDDSPERAFMIGDRYERILKLGEGTYGKVYKARDTETGDIVALKKCRIQVGLLIVMLTGCRRRLRCQTCAVRLHTTSLRPFGNLIVCRWTKKVYLRPRSARFLC